MARIFGCRDASRGAVECTRILAILHLTLSCRDYWHDLLGSSDVDVLRSVAFFVTPPGPPRRFFVQVISTTIWSLTNILRAKSYKIYEEVRHSFSSIGTESKPAVRLTGRA